MIQRSMIIKSNDAFGNEYSKTVTNVNTAATNQQMDTWARAFVGLSKNTYKDTVRVDSESITEALAE